MISSLAMAPASSWYSTSSSVVVRVEKATSEFLTGPDWPMNIDICDIINTSRWVAKDVLKSLKKRLQNKNPKVQLLSLTLVETMVKNCSDVVHVQISERNILTEMVKIVKKTMDTHVRDKILVLIDSWQEAFGGPGGKFPQYYWAYQELKLAGVGFPPRSYDTAPIFTPPMSHLVHQPQLEYEMPSNSSTRHDGNMVAEMEKLSLSTISSMRSIVDLLAEMLLAVKPGDRAAVKDEVIVDLVERCRANQKKLIDMLTTNRDDGLLERGLDLNDILQSVLGKHDAIASGTALPNPVEDIKHPTTESRVRWRADTREGGRGETSYTREGGRGETSYTREGGRADTSDTEADAKSLVPVSAHLDEEEDGKKEDCGGLVQRRSKTSPAAPREGEGKPLDPAMSALIVIDPPEPTKATKEQEIIEQLSITLSSSLPPDTPGTPVPTSAETMNQKAPVSSFNPGNPHTPHSYPGHQSYVAPWAQPQPQMQTFAQNPQFQHHSLSMFQQMPQSNAQFRHYQSNGQFPQNSSGYTPPWAPTPGYFSQSNQSFPPLYMYSSTPQPPATSSSSPHLPANSFPAMGNNGNAQVSATTGLSSPEQKSFIPPYRLFEDLNVLVKGDHQYPKTTGNPAYNLFGANSHNIIDLRK
ncbi:PREDICTED: target of Myb protein 1-like [Ipomoea nil]|uniref:target of Myb protein 1-like n=1 Tax=Ipomoea nil TaxID=35883 RepID=UPI000900CEC6|nr:PREDICTED: target of Myb protein 1-like [Ipomoea nil]